VNYEKKLNEDGVTLVKNCINLEVMRKVREKYDELNSNITRTEIEKDKPIIVFWQHVIGEKKRLSNFIEFPQLWELITNHIKPKLREIIPKRAERLQLMETIVFNKPAKTSNTLNWHQDVAYFPVEPNNQIAVWIPFEKVDYSRGAMNYALGSHKLGIKASTNLHTREVFSNDDRELIPEDPSKAGFKVVCMEMEPIDMLIHDGFVWHYSGPNTEQGYTRKGLSVRFFTDQARYYPRPGQGAAFTQ
jgi:ectoine hydroxylase-related dioxygenase (phytanoyl-CoA dioxygenase family)